MGKNGPRMEKKQPTPRFDSEKLMTVSCLTRLIDRKLIKLVVRDADSSTVIASATSPVFVSVTSLELSSAYIDRFELPMLNLGDSAICSQASPLVNRPVQTTCQPVSRAYLFHSRTRRWVFDGPLNSTFLRHNQWVVQTGTCVPIKRWRYSSRVLTEAHIII